MYFCTLTLCIQAIPVIVLGTTHLKNWPEVAALKRRVCVQVIQHSIVRWTHFQVNIIVAAARPGCSEKAVSEMDLKGWNKFVELEKVI